MIKIKTRKSTFIFLTINIGLDLLIIIISSIILNSDLIKKGLLYYKIIKNIIEILYIIYRFFRIVNINACIIQIKSFFLFLDFANIGVVLYYAYKDENKDLSNKQVRIYMALLLIFISKLYIHFFSFVRMCKFVGHFELRERDVELTCEKDREAFPGSEKKKELNKLKEENALLIKINKSLKGKSTNLIKDFFKKKKTEIICQYIKSNFNIDITQKLLQRLFLEIKNSGLFLDKQKYEEIIAYYIKERLLGIIKDPITGGMIYAPVITPDGQTFGREEISEVIRKEGKNPVTNNDLTEKQLITNSLVLEIIQILTFNDNFNLEHVNKIKNLLISEKTKKFYVKPYVISTGKNRGRTDEQHGNGVEEQYPNQIIFDLIYRNLEIFDDNFQVFDLDLGKNYNTTRNVTINNNYDTNMVNSEDIHMIKK